MRECWKLREDELAEEKRKKDEARKLIIEGMKRVNKMKATLREHVNPTICQYYMEMYVKSEC